MAMMNLLEIVQRTARRLSLPVPTAAFSSTDPTWQQGVEILMDLGEELNQANEWSYAVTSKTITITAVNYHAEPLMSDYDRLKEDGSLYRTISMLPVIGPVSSSEWELLTIYNAGFLPGAWRLFNNTLNIFGIAVNETVKFEYVSKNWIIDSTGATKKSAWTADSDLPRLPDALLRLGLQWKWKRAKGFDYGQEKADFEDMREKLIAKDRGLKTIQTSSTIRSDEIMDGTWPGVVVP